VANTHLAPRRITASSACPLLHPCRAQQERTAWLLSSITADSTKHHHRQGTCSRCRCRCCCHSRQQAPAAGPRALPHTQALPLRRPAASAVMGLAQRRRHHTCQGPARGEASAATCGCCRCHCCCCQRILTTAGSASDQSFGGAAWSHSNSWQLYVALDAHAVHAGVIGLL
jgi:hypothetical protein